MSSGTIEFTKEVVFKDREGTILKTFNVGDRISFTAKTSTYWVCSPGGIWFDEAKEVEVKD